MLTKYKSTDVFLDILRPYGKGNVMELGSHTGHILYFLSKELNNFSTLVDVNDLKDSIIKEWEGKQIEKDYNFVKVSMASKEFPEFFDRCYDLIFQTNVFHAYGFTDEKILQTLLNVKNLLTNDGVFIVCIPDCNSPAFIWKDMKIPVNLEKLFIEAGLKIQEKRILKSFTELYEPYDFINYKLTK